MERATAGGAPPASFPAFSVVDADRATSLGTPTMYVAPRVTYYKMRAIDANCAVSPPTYRTWVATGSPDTGAKQYSGAFGGPR